jgi:hypothetical protein
MASPEPHRPTKVKQRDKAFEPLTFDMGRPRLDLTKAASLAAELEDDELIGRYRRSPLILPDVNTPLYAANRTSDQHTAALRALRRGFGDPRDVALAWTALLAFLRLATRCGIFPKPLSVEDRRPNDRQDVGS